MKKTMFELYRNKYPKIIYDYISSSNTKTIPFKDQCMISDEIGKLYSSSLNKKDVFRPPEHKFFPIMMTPFEFLILSDSTNIQIPIMLDSGIETIPKCVKNVFFVMICVKDNIRSKRPDIITLVLGSISTSSDKWVNTQFQNGINGIRKILKLSDLDPPEIPTLEPIVFTTTVESKKCSNDNLITEEPLLPSEKEEEIDINNFDIYTENSNESTSMIHIPSHKMIHLYIPTIDCDLNPNANFSLYLYHTTWLSTIKNLIIDFKDNKDHPMSDKVLKNIYFAMGYFGRESIVSQKIFIHMIVRILCYHNVDRLKEMIIWIYKSIIQTWINNIYRLRYIIGDETMMTTVQKSSTKNSNDEISFYSSEEEECENENEEDEKNGDECSKWENSKANIELKQQELIDTIIVPKVRDLCDRMKMLDHWNNIKQNYFYNHFQNLFQQWCLVSQ